MTKLVGEAEIELRIQPDSSKAYAAILRLKELAGQIERKDLRNDLARIMFGIVDDLMTAVTVRSDSPRSGDILKDTDAAVEKAQKDLFHKDA